MPAPAGLLLHLFDFAACAGELEQAQATLDLLAPGESAPTAADRTLTGERRLARIALRLALAAAGESDAVGQPFAETARGKPLLPHAAHHFSVSHTASYALIAITRAGPVGVDLERVRPLRLGPHRAAQIVAAARGLGADLPSRRDLTALAAWTALEAWAKAEGCGIGTLLTTLGIVGPASRKRPPETIADRASDHRRALPHALRSLDLGPGFQGFVCAPAADLATATAPAPVPLAAKTASSVSALVTLARTYRLTAPPAQGHKEPGTGA